MDGFTQEQIDQLESANKRIARIKSKTPGEWEIIIRRPARKEFKRYRAAQHNEAQKADAQELLMRTIVVATCVRGAVTLDVAKARDAFDQLLEDYPAIADSTAAANALQRLTSDAVEDDEK